MRRGEWLAGAVSAAVMLPQAVILAALAGMPPESGIYASVFPALVATWRGASPCLLTGPNTALAVLCGSAVSLLMPAGGAQYMALMLFISLLAGCMQLAMGWCRAAALLDFLPASGVAGVTAAAGVALCLSQSGNVTGMAYQAEDMAWLNAWRIAGEPAAWDGSAVAVAAATVVACCVAGRTRWRTMTLPIGMACGMGAAGLLWAVGGYSQQMLGHLQLRLWAGSVPVPPDEAWPYLWQVVLVAMSAAVLGLLQTVVIARGLAEAGRAQVDMNREIRAQGWANLCAALSSGFPVSGSFNRTAAHVAAGARGKGAAVAASVLLLAAAACAEPGVAYLPLPAMGGMLLYLGWKLIDAPACRALLRHPGMDRWLFVAALASGVAASLVAAVCVAVLLSIAGFLRQSANPCIACGDGDAEFDYVLVFRGHLYFATVRKLETVLRELEGRPGRRLRIALHAPYVDAEGQRMLQREQQRWRRAGGELHIERL